MQFDRGCLSPYFVTDPERMEVVLESITMDDLGQAKRVTVDKDNTTIIEAAGDAAAPPGTMPSSVRPRWSDRRCRTRRQSHPYC